MERISLSLPIIRRASLIPSLPGKVKYTNFIFALLTNGNKSFLFKIPSVMFVKTIVVLLFFVSSTFGCLIINCPRGGKRDGGFTSLKYPVRECPACGPEQQGQCFGPKICCGPSIGCFFGTADTYKCRKESLYSRPCNAGFAMCRGNTGRCAANGICCSQESCYVDPNCKIGDDSNMMNNLQGSTFNLATIFSENNPFNDQ